MLLLKQLEQDYKRLSRTNRRARNFNKSTIRLELGYVVLTPAEQTNNCGRDIK